MNGNIENGSDNGRDTPLGNRKRIRIACDNCRRKKIKCNGENPCANCIPSKSECFYKERKVRKRNSGDKLGRSSNSKNFDHIDLRLSKLETIISKLSKNIEVIVNGRSTEDKSPDARNDTNYDTDGNEVDADDDDDDDDDDDETDDTNDTDDNESRQNNAILQVASSNNYIVAPTAVTHPPNSKVKTVDYTFPSEQYFGLHSIMCIFSNQSLDWIEKTLGTEAETLVPVRNVPLIFKTKLRTFLLKFMDPPIVDLKARRRLLERPFPGDPNLVFTLLNAYYIRLTNINSLAPSAEMNKLFEEYYLNFESAKPNSPRKRRKFKQSELLIMTVALMFSITTKIDQEIIQSNSNSPNSTAKLDTPRSLQDLPDAYLLTLKETLFDNAIYYYQRICVISDGIDTIRAILLLITYIESNFVFCEVNYILCSVAIRFAQEMGLHRSESYQNLPREEQIKRRTVWWYCHFYDVEICFRSGKPPLINSSDVTTNTDFDPNAFMSYNPFDLNSNIYNGQLTQGESSDLNTESLELCEGKTETTNFHKFGLLLTNIRAKSYNCLFAAGVNLESLDALCRTVDMLNSEMFELAECTHPSLRPRFVNDREFRMLGGAGTPASEGLIGIQFIYFLNMMLINRIPSVVRNTSVERTNNLNKYRQLSLDAARTILVLASQLNTENCFASFFNWISFYPASAFLSLAASVLNHPHSPEAYSDLNLLRNTSINFFSMRVSTKKGGKNLYVHNNSMIALIMKLMLNVVVRFYESKTHTSIFKEDRMLQDHLNSSRSEYPDIYRSPSDFKSKMSSVVMGESPFQSSSVSNYFEQGKAGGAGDCRNNGCRGNTVERSFSPSSNPSVANILHSNDIQDPIDNTSYSGTTMKNRDYISKDSPSFFGQNEIIPDIFDDDVLTQFNNLPNFFFDNHFEV